MTLTCFDVRFDGSVAHLRLNRPEQKNSLVPAFWAELRTLVEDIDRQASARVIVLSSTGRHFCAGLDLGVFDGGMFRAQGGGDEPGRKRAVLYQGIRSLQATFTALERARVPVIAAVQGGCVGAGLGLVAACDLRYATRDAFFLVQETNLGITAEVGQLQRLPKVMPEGIAREMAYRGMRLPAARAESVGFVNAVFDDHEALLDGVSEIAREIAAKSPLAVWGSKHSLNHARDHAVDDGLDLVALWQAGMYHPDDCLESLSAQQERRSPVFEDLRPIP
ncbi:enoyl-CoA hydratase/isomerase family protein [Frankia sp. AgB1.9]|uniref:enoyl-CoA hydratase-related protein n=1 Tax=unclassified Frankia TaxID=2632575 RepID=UPI001931C520|nr:MULTISPECIES: enoyl-CoA hydratase-related protein [unclassified Frankia]MBL7487268.1 enoyl-CoA hydratase/isomerase family protein [Frankia sp. AgW1.1]MBL7546275.1 enoyl-CoA hydratase/isomerase family protein [Frankia sp. AgB1.9]MBL7618680.1 enoyl-CoA hydratase/isomerase family protein [Frankia sp. AgB1.8]